MWDTPCTGYYVVVVVVVVALQRNGPVSMQIIRVDDRSRVELLLSMSQDEEAGKRDENLQSINC